MPKLSAEAMEEKRGRIEDAAKELFIKRGFHATSMRDISRGTGTSLGNLYNYYRTKEEILESIIRKYQKVIDARLRAIFDDIERPAARQRHHGPARRQRLHGRNAKVFQPGE